MFSERYIMVLGGKPDPDGRESEIIDIIDPTRTCAGLQEFPEHAEYSPTGAIMNNNSLIVCGYTKCFEYKNNQWSQLGIKTHIARDYTSYHVIRGKGISQ